MRPRVTLAVVAALLAGSAPAAVLASGTKQGVGAALPAPAALAENAGRVVFGHDVKHDTSPPLRDMPPAPIASVPEHEASPNPQVLPTGTGRPDPVVQRKLAKPNMPDPILSFEGIPFPGVACNCAPPDTNGEVGATQYVQIVNMGYQVFDKTSGNSLLGPVAITTIWNGFGGNCQFNGGGDPIVLYDQLANRWVVSEFAGVGVATDECVAVSATSDATGSYHRYDFHLGSNFFDYPKLAVWPDAYYLAENVFNSSGTDYLGPQPFALNRAAMLAGTSATFVSTGILTPNVGALLPGDLDGSMLPPAGAPDPFLASGGTSFWPFYRFHVDFATPSNSTFTHAFNLTPAALTPLCFGNCVPQLGTEELLEGLGDRGMFRLAYRRFPDGHEALVGNRTVSSNDVAGIRWFEINNATSGTPSFVQQST